MKQKIPQSFMEFWFVKKKGVLLFFAKNGRSQSRTAVRGKRKRENSVICSFCGPKRCFVCFVVWL